MAALDAQWNALVKQLKKLEVDTRKARGEARVRLNKLEKQARTVIERALREAEPRMRQAMKEAARIGRSLRAGMEAGAAAYRRASTRKRKK
jgi:hypothetical protein